MKTKKNLRFIFKYNFYIILQLLISNIKNNEAEIAKENGLKIIFCCWLELQSFFSLPKIDLTTFLSTSISIFSILTPSARLTRFSMTISTRISRLALCTLLSVRLAPLFLLLVSSAFYSTHSLLFHSFTAFEAYCCYLIEAESSVRSHYAYDYFCPAAMIRWPYFL